MLLDRLRQIGRKRGAGAKPVGDERTATLDVAAALARMGPSAAAPAILVPIYNAAREADDCIAAVLKHTSGDCRIVLLDDSSPDTAVEAVLARYDGLPKVEVYRNDRNLGFTRNVNLGIEIAGGADVVILNSDTKVTPRWLDNLRLAAYSADEVATATPFSNNAGAFSTPDADQANTLPDWLTLDAYARLVTQSSAREYPRVPTGNGFCMYIRRDCLDRIGAFDAEAFPRGYGEENDFCMRAGRAGKTHVVDDSTLVYHVRSASFGDEKSELMRHGRAVLDARYPDYAALARNFARIDALRRARLRIAGALERSRRAAPRPRVLLVLPEGRQVASDDSQAGWEVLRLTGAGAGVEAARPDAGLSPTAVPQGEAALANWLVSRGVERVRASSGDAGGLTSICARLNIPVEP